MHRLAVVLACLLALGVWYLYDVSKDKDKSSLSIFFGGLLIAFVGFSVTYLLVNFSPFASEHVLLCLAVISAGRLISSARRASPTVRTVILLLIVFAANGLVAQFINRHASVGSEQSLYLTVGFQTACVPLLVALLANAFLKTKDDVEKGLFFASMSLALFFIFGLGCNMTGLTHEVQDGVSGQVTTVFDFSLIQYTVWANWYGAAAAVAIIVPLVRLVFEKEMSVMNIGMLGLAVLTLLRAGTRGGILASGISIIGIFMAGIMFIGNPARATVRLFMAGGVLSVCVAAGLLGLSENAMAKLTALLVYGLEEGNVVCRLDLLEDAIYRLKSHFLGIGLGKLWELEHVDEASYFVYIMNGVGVVGITCVVFVLLYLLFLGLKGVARGSEYSRRHSLICALVALCIIIAGNSSDQIMAASQTSIAVWTMIMCCLKAQELELAEAPAAVQNSFGMRRGRQRPGIPTYHVERRSKDGAEGVENQRA